MIQRTVEYSQPSISMDSTFMDSIIWDQKYSGKKVSKSSKEQNLNMLCTRKCFHSIHIALGSKSNLCVCAVCSVVSSSSRPHGLKLIRLLCPGDFPGKNTGAGCHLLLQGICPTQGSNLRLCVLCLLHWQADSFPLSHLGSPL